MAMLGAAATAIPSLMVAAPTMAEEAGADVTPDEALKKLREGNALFVADAEQCAVNLTTRRAEVALGQHPYAVILTCSDSRVTPELIFGGVSLGELFVARNAGNIVDTDVLGTLEYGTEHLHAPLIVVMGHEKCGAVGAAVDQVVNGTQYEGSIGKMIQPILPVALGIGADDPDLGDKTIRANAAKGVELILQDSPIIATLVEEGKVKVIAAYYNFQTGAVEFSDAA
ncbi:carbonic anhydrase [Devosia sp. FKR38]|uniref:carbonic anhydrase n=1 Tax=Devosia sp. FKR38 TaxID=2562312 RepID=UPI0020BD8157|nr:carbonic anhydrase [Devosia sp. FKR38]